MHAYSSSSSSQHHESSTWASSSSFHVWNHERGRRACATRILTGPSVPWMDGSTWTDAIWAHIFCEPDVVFNPVLCLTHFSSPVPVIARSFIAPPKESIISQDIYNISTFWREDKSSLSVGWFVSLLVREKVLLANLCERKILFRLKIYDRLRQATVKRTWWRTCMDSGRLCSGTNLLVCRDLRPYLNQLQLKLRWTQI